MRLQGNTNVVTETVPASTGIQVNLTLKTLVLPLPCLVFQNPTSIKPLEHATKGAVAWVRQGDLESDYCIIFYTES